jgi:capsular polysaccharide biosynthesis protein
VDFHKAFKVVKRQRWTLITVAFVAVVVVAFSPQKQAVEAPVVYQSQAKILLTPSSGNVRAYGGTVSAGPDYSNTWFTDQTIINEVILSEELLSRVSSLSQHQTPWFELKSRITLEPMSQHGRGVNLLLLKFTGGDPKETQKLTRLLSDEFSNYVQELSAQEYAATRRFIEELVLEAEQRRLQAEEDLMTVREKYLGLPTDDEIRTRQQALESQRQETQREIGSLQAEIAAIRAYRDSDGATTPWIILEQSEGAISGLETNVANQKLELAKLREVYTDDSSAVKAAEARLATAQRLYSSALGEYVESLYTDKSTRLQQAISQSQSLSAQLNDILKYRMTDEDRRELAKLERQRTLWDENHLSLLQQLYQARVVEQSSRRQGSVTVLEQPRLGSPISGGVISAGGRSKTESLALALPFALLLGLGAAFLKDYMSSTMRLRPKVEEALEIPVIAVIPSTPSELTVDWERFKRPLGLASVEAEEQETARVRR